MGKRLNHGVRAAYVLQNVGTQSFVTHTESSFGVEPVCLIWDDLEKAKAHARDLYIEYSIAKPSLPEHVRTWRVRRATQDQILKALAVGAYGPEYTDRIRDTTEKIGGNGTPPEQAEAFRDELDANRRN
jgi:hypothetical protein